MSFPVVVSMLTAVVSGGHYAAHRVFSGEVYSSKSGSLKADLVVTGRT